MTFFLGLTGSIGMGKSTTAGLFRAAGCPVHDADAEVHALYAAEAVGPVGEAFPDAVSEGGVDRAKLGALVIGKPDRLKALEAIVHPLVQQREQAFRQRCLAGRAPVAILDIPLLFETGAPGRCDAVVVVTAPPDVQQARVLARPGMTEERLAGILTRQMPDAEKRARAHFIVDTSLGLASAQAEVSAILRALAGREGHKAA